VVPSDRSDFLIVDLQVLVSTPDLNSGLERRCDAAMRFVIRRNSAGQYWWRAVADNNEILCASELMTSKAACLNGINVVKSEAKDAPVYDKTDETAVRHAV
jgi:uncharacterized protein YegP (UPF0339 family)